MTFGEFATLAFFFVACVVVALWCAAVLACAGFIAFTLAAGLF